MLNEKIRIAFKQKYGVDNPSKIEDVIEKKRRNTYFRYKVESTNQIPMVKQKKKDTVESNFIGGYKNESIIEKRRKTCLAKYGVDNVMKLKCIQERKQATSNQTFDQSGLRFDSVGH